MGCTDDGTPRDNLADAAGSDVTDAPNTDVDAAAGPEAERLTLKQRTYHVAVGEQIEVESVVSFSDGSTQRNPEGLQWETQDPTIASVVAEEGIVTGQRAGRTELVARLDELSASADVLVEHDLDPRLELEDDELVLAKSSDEVALEYTAFDETGEEIAVEPHEISWNSSSQRVVMVDSGTLTPMRAGDAVVTARWRGASDTVEVTVKAVESLELVPDQDRLDAGDTLSLELRYLAADRRPLDVDAPVTWTLDDERLASIAADGEMTAQRGGQLEVRAESLGMEASAHFLIDAHFVDMECFSEECCALSEDGHAYCMGENDWGELGVGDSQPRDYLALVESDVQFETIDVGWHLACGLTATGKAYCWGSNAGKNLGFGQIDVREEVPGAVSTTNHFVDIETHNWGVSALTQQGELYFWGFWPPDFKSWDPPYSTHPTPALIDPGPWDELVETSSGVSCVRQGADYFCAGYNEYGQLGQGPEADSPVDSLGRFESPVPLTSLAAAKFTLCGLDENGHVWCAGEYFWGLLGYEWTPGLQGMHRTDTPVRIPIDETFDTLVSAGSTFCGLRDGEEMWCWGFNSDCQLGYSPGSDSYDHSHTPVHMSFLPKDWTKFVPGTHHGCILNDDGEVHCWGLNPSGSSVTSPGEPIHCEPALQEVKAYPESP